MRDLTQQEIDNAPALATHYYYDAWGRITYRQYENTGDYRLRKRKEHEFNIENYEFDQSMIIEISPNILRLCTCGCANPTNVEIDLDLAKALAKYFKLTEDDLK